MKEPWTVDVKFADGEIIQAQFHYGEAAKSFARRMNQYRRAFGDKPSRQYSGLAEGLQPVGIQVWKTYRQLMPSVVYGEGFTY